MNKICSKCGLSKGLTEFYKDRSKTDGLRSHCKLCINSFNRQDRVQKYRQAALNRFKARDDFPERDRSYCYKYRHSDRGRAIKRQQARRYRERQAGVKDHFTLEDAAIVRRRFGYRCFNCGTKDSLTIDHHRPLSRGNALSHTNAVLLCVSCNSSKNAKLPEDFYSMNQLEVLYGKGVV